MRYIFIFGWIFAVVSAVPLIGGAQPWLAASAQQHDNAREALKRGEIMPYSSIKKIVERQIDGKIVGQKLRRTNQGWQYDLRVRADGGRVMVLVVDATNGNIVSRR